MTKPPHKKRKLNANSATDGLLNTPHVQATHLNTSSPIANTELDGALECISCHRILRGMPGYTIFCARCKSPTCAICSRTCTARVPSQPPTPCLTFSPTPASSPVSSPRRLALRLNMTNTTPPLSSLGKRLKPIELDERDAENEDKGNYRSRFYGAWKPGCQRVVCCHCCFDDMQTDLTTCYDCYGSD